MPTEPDTDWAPCPGCDQPILLDFGDFVMHLVWFNHPADPDDVRSVIECDWSRKPCLDRP